MSNEFNAIMEGVKVFATGMWHFIVLVLLWWIGSELSKLNERMEEQDEIDDIGNN